MRSVPLILVLALAAGAPAAAAPQQGQRAPDQPARQARTPQASDARPVELPVSIERIRRKLAQAPPSKTSGLRLQYYVEVYGKSPQIDLFTDFDPTTGAVQYGSPTHQEFLTLVTPEEFRAPAGDLLTPAVALMKWLIDKGTDKTRKKPDPPR